MLGGGAVSAPVIAPGLSTGAYLRTEFLERVSHELRGPMGVTSGALDEMELALGPNAEALRTYFLMARRGMRRVLRVAERLHRTALLEAGTVEWALVPTDLRGLVRAAVMETELLEARRGVRVDLSCSEEVCWVAADPDWMHAAIAEVVGNAIRYARSVVSIHAGASTDEGRVTISDDGPGFNGPPALRFEPLSDKRGVGLSLPIVCDVIAAHDGRFEIDGPRTSGGNVSSGGQVVLILPLLKKGET
jgi:two-component system, OmpR family, sensor histidine kinase RstB